MCPKHTIYQLPINTPNGDINLSVRHKVVDENLENMWVTISTNIEGHDVNLDAETTEKALYKLAKSLPNGWRIKSCLSCRYGHFCPAGNGDNELFCVTEFEPKEICDLWHVTEDTEERNKRSRILFHLCDKYQPQSKDYFTYSDYYFKSRD